MDEIKESQILVNPPVNSTKEEVFRIQPDYPTNEIVEPTYEIVEPTNTNEATVKPILADCGCTDVSDLSSLNNQENMKTLFETRILNEKYQIYKTQIRSLIEVNNSHGIKDKIKMSEIRNFTKSLFPLMKLLLKYSSTSESSDDIIADLIEYIRNQVANEYNFDINLKIDQIRLDNILVDFTKILKTIDDFIMLLGDKCIVINFPSQQESKEILLEVNAEHETINEISPIANRESANIDLEDLKLAYEQNKQENVYNTSSIHCINPKEEIQYQTSEHIDQILERAQKDIFYRYSKQYIRSEVHQTFDSMLLEGETWNIGKLSKFLSDFG